MEGTPSLPSVTEIKRAKSPPLAFEKTPNDALASFPPASSQSHVLGDSTETMGKYTSQDQDDDDQRDLRVIVEQQASALQLLHDAFSAERNTWNLEKNRLHLRIYNLEKLLRVRDGYSPAKSPVLSPFANGDMTSPQSRAFNNPGRLPSIAEDDAPSLSQRRSNAPLSIDMPEIVDENEKASAVSFAAEDTPIALKVDEFAVSPPKEEARGLSPPPFHNRMQAGHTPLRAPRPLTPPPKNSLAIDGIDDTPTRNNTQVNTYLTQSNEDDEESGDKELKGPLNMPELPHMPDESNFTLDMLSRRLAQLEQDPDASGSKPMVFCQPSPGLASPVEEEPPIAPVQTHRDHSNLSSQALSPITTGLSPLAPSRSREEKVQADFETGGIRLKKKASSNFGAPFGSLGGFGSVRRSSHDPS